MPAMETKVQISSGGVAYQKTEKGIEVALISVGENERWQLPKGLVDKGEKPEQTAIREVHEEAGLETELEKFLGKVEYWYYSKDGENRIRYHKFVYFYLLRTLGGDIKNHDWEVNEARWIDIDQAGNMLAFNNEKEILTKARESLQA